MLLMSISGVNYESVDRLLTSEQNKIHTQILKKNVCLVWPCAPAYMPVCKDADQPVHCLHAILYLRAQLFKASLLNELVKGHFVSCFSGFNRQYSDFFG